MKKVLLLMLLVASSLTASAQDVIVKKDGSTILSKVIEIGTTEIKYKKWNNQNGPMYTIDKNDVQTINYENGEKETFSDVVTSQPQQGFNYNDYTSQMAESMAANNRLQKERLLASAKSWRVVGNVWYWVSFLGGIGGGIALYASGYKESTYWICAGSGVASGLIGLGICSAVANNKEKAANSIASVPLIKQDFNIGNSRLSAVIDLMNDPNTRDKALGIGLSLNF